jgi:SAM-dependent methyltransferase
MPDAAEAHARQIAFWNGQGAEMWVLRQAQMDASLAPVGAATLALAAPQPGEHVLDIGCGTGETVLTLAERVGPQGHVTGLDISAPMLGLARTRAAGLANVTLVLGDAAAHAFPPEAADLLFSRFGVMFFGDPVAAFANMRKGLRAGGRVVFACWQEPRANPWATAALEAVAPFLAAPPVDPPGLPGQFAFGDANHVARILTAAGFTTPSFTPFQFQMPLGRTLDDAVQRASEFGTTGRALAEMAPERKAEAMVAIRAALAPMADAEGFVAGTGAVWLVCADRK